jgi:hypothetical protein
VSRTLRAWCLSLIAATGLAVAATPASAATVDPAPIGPHQYFAGVVNGQTGQALIQMGCIGPIHPGQTGHPLPGQTVNVVPVPSSTTTDVGYTGSAATAIDVTMGAPSSTVIFAVLRYYGVTAPIPTSLVLPCAGSGTVVFIPSPTSTTARSASVAVTFVGQP